MTRTYAVHTRRQKAKGSGPFHGPDTYVAVTGTPDGIVLPYPLNSAVLSKRGITLKYFGEGYAEHSGPRSVLGRSLAAASEYASWKNRVEEAWADPVVR